MFCLAVVWISEPKGYEQLKKILSDRVWALVLEKLSRVCEVGRVSPRSPSQEFESHLSKQGLAYAICCLKPVLLCFVCLLIRLVIGWRRLLNYSFSMAITFQEGEDSGYGIMGEGQGAAGTPGWDQV